MAIPDLTPEFMEAMIATLDDNANLGDAGAMQAVGINRSDTVELSKSLLGTYGRALATGWDCPACGRICEEDGTCPDGCEFEVHQDPLLRRMETMVALTEIALSVGVHLERARMDVLLREKEATE